jgi:hypothetical protein
MHRSRALAQGCFLWVVAQIVVGTTSASAQYTPPFNPDPGQAPPPYTQPTSPAPGDPSAPTPPIPAPPPNLVSAWCENGKLYIQTCSPGLNTCTVVSREEASCAAAVGGGPVQGTGLCSLDGTGLTISADLFLTAMAIRPAGQRIEIGPHLQMSCVALQNGWTECKVWLSGISSEPDRLVHLIHFAGNPRDYVHRCARRIGEVIEDVVDGTQENFQRFCRETSPGVWTDQEGSLCFGLRWSW